MCQGQYVKSVILPARVFFFAKRIQLVKSGGFMSSEIRAYKGHYASGTAKYCLDDGRIYAGHFASGTAVASVDRPSDLPLYVLAFVATLF